MQKELPKGWVESQFKDVGEVVTGNTPSKSNSDYFGGDFPWIKPGDLKDRKITEFEESLTELGAKKIARILPPNSVMVSCIGNLGKIGIIDRKATTNQQINSVVFNKSIVNPFFGFYYALTLKEWLYENSSATTVSIINKGRFEKAPIPLPPLPTQHRIVSKLDTLFGHLDALKTRLDHIPQLLKAFRQSVLTQAVTGKLTVEWRKGKELEEWKNIRLESVCKSITDGDHQAPPQVKEGIPFLVISNVSKGFFDFENVTRFVPRSYFESLKEYRIPKKGDVLFTVTGSFGIPLLVDFEREFCFQRHIAILRPDNSKINSSFLQIVLNSSKIMDQARDVATGTAQLTVPLSGVRNFIADIPTLEEQQEIVRRVESLFAKADRIEAQYQNLKAKIEQLPQALLAKAFRGELVEQLPGDGDAGELLRQIQVLKNEGGKAKSKIEISRSKKLIWQALGTEEKEEGLSQVAEDGAKYNT
jgi:type I restriction enzyme S subunit